MTARMRVGLNLLWLRPGEVGGSESYAMRVVAAMLEHEAVDVAAFVSRAAVEAHAETLERTAVHVAPRLAASPMRRVALERTWLARTARDVDVMHHVGGTVPRGRRGGVVVTIHDLQPLDVPTNFSSLKRRWLALAIPAAIDRADVIVTPSAWVRTSVLDRFDVDPARVHVVSAYAGAPVVDAEPSPVVRALLDAGPVMLYPAMTLAHKNHEMLFGAFAEAVRLRPELRLVCVGSADRDHARIVALADRTPGVHHIGYVSGTDLQVLYARSEALVFPSRYEGFGLPVLEAQRAGLPVIASTAGPLPEISGGAAVLLDPDDGDAWVDALRTPMSAAFRQELVDAGIRNAARYTAEATARAQVEAYRHASGIDPGES